MSFTESFEKSAGFVDNTEIDRADVTLPEKDTGTARRTLQMARGQRQMNKSTGQSKAGKLTSNFWENKEIDPERFPAKSWINSRIPGN